MKSHGGRPKTRELPTSFVGFRVSHEVKAWLVQSAAASGRSISAEARFRLENSFRDDELRAMFRAQHAKTA
jgi:plasmid stability protein